MRHSIIVDKMWSGYANLIFCSLVADHPLGGGYESHLRGACDAVSRRFRWGGLSDCGIFAPLPGFHPGEGDQWCLRRSVSFGCFLVEG